MTPFEDLPVWTMAEWMGQKAEIERLRAELALALSNWREGECCADCRCHGYVITPGDEIHSELEQRQSAAIARVRELCDYWAQPNRPGIISVTAILRALEQE